MNPRARHIKPLPDFTMIITFINGETKVFDFKPYLQLPIYKDLYDVTLFMQAKVINGILVWTDEIDFCPDRLYLESVSL